MSYLTRATELVGRPIVSVDRAEDVAEVKDVVFDAARSDFLGFTLRGRGLFGTPDRGHLPASAIVSIGRDAVMIRSESEIMEEVPDLARAGSDRRDVIGDEVLTDTGRRIGIVRDLVLQVDRDRADVVGYEVETEDGAKALVPVPETFAVSGETLVVPSSVEGFMTHDLSGFGGSVDRFREHVGRTANDPRPSRDDPRERPPTRQPGPPPRDEHPGGR
jgi:uncharacterized protein YrrD